MNERYRLVRPLAAGGMAELFLGVARAAEGFERTVAIKRVLPQLAREPDIARMFLAEARLATQLQHQNIATVYDVGQGPEGLFLVMELVDGWDLGVLLRAASRRGRRFPPHLAAFVTLQTLAGLIHAYRKQHEGRPVMVAHRDVSPSNVLVSREGEVKVTDFGIARLGGLSLTEPGVFKGKEAYSAPEVLQGLPATAVSDQFSLGIVFYELLTGRHPFSSVKEPVAVVHAILSRDVPPPEDVPAPLADTVMRMLAREPTARFPSPEALAEVLARWLARSGEPASSHTLAAFLAELKLPPTLRELGEAGGDDALTADPRLATRPVDPHTFALEGDLPSVTGGPALSTSGRLVHRCTRCGSPLSAPRAPCDHCAAELAPPSPAFALVPEPSAASRPSWPSGSSPGGAAPADSAQAPTPGSASPGRNTPGGTLIAGLAQPGAGPSSAASAPGAQTSSAGSGAGASPPGAHSPATASAPGARAPSRQPAPGASVPGPHAPAKHAPTHASAARASPPHSGSAHAAGGGPPLSLADSLGPEPTGATARSVLHTPPEALELAERAPRPESTWVDGTAPRSGRRWGRAVVLLGVLAALVGGGAWLWLQRATVMPPLLASVGLSPAPQVLSIQSEPPGATVLVDGTAVGTTPLAVDNLYPEGPIPVQVRLKGYRTWKGTFRGGEPVQLQVTLER